MPSHLKTEISSADSGANKSSMYSRNFLREELSAGQSSAMLGIVRFALAAKQMGMPEATLRDTRFYADDRVAANGQVIPGNGFAPAFLKLGRALYVDIPMFGAILRSKNSKGGTNG